VEGQVGERALEQVAVEAVEVAGTAFAALLFVALPPEHFVSEARELV
jgi:hypothetical protein